MDCKDIPERFTIRTVSPHLPDDKSVSPYCDDFTCTEIKPTSANLLEETKYCFSSIASSYNLTKNWPNLYVKKNEEIPNHLEFWKQIWKQHGMCTIPNDPYFYFGANMILYKYIIIISTDIGITSGNSKYQVGDILTKLKKKFGVYPQIACNQKHELQEIRFCFFLEGSAFYKDCPNKLDDNNN
ncbi:hypothetical protein PVK06_036151 [Gossypium arboreum]|uniref:Uncharacterized protein n=1 Tax=Gossypium arboreum TaxID=29729 RepID=A0ABR0NKX9_GOSAR|nr:hypothetical protein PVK06_036151 [Gossypium arboreum]